MKIEIIGNLVTPRGGGWENPQRGIIYSANGLVGCLNGLDFRANQPKIIYIYED